jgi:hypothetical protein
MSLTNDFKNTPSNAQKLQGFPFDRQMRSQSTCDYAGIMNEFQDMSLLGSGDAAQILGPNASYLYEHDDGDYLHSLNTEFTNMNMGMNTNNKSCSSGYGGSTSLSSSESLQNIIQAYDTNSSFSNDSVFSTPTTPTTPCLQHELNKFKSIKNKSPPSIANTVPTSGFMSNYMNNTNINSMQQQQSNLNENLQKLQYSLENFMSSNNNQHQASKHGGTTPLSYLTSSNSFNQVD